MTLRARGHHARGRAENKHPYPHQQSARGAADLPPRGRFIRFLKAYT